MDSSEQPAEELVAVVALVFVAVAVAWARLRLSIGASFVCIAKDPVACRVATHFKSMALVPVLSSLPNTQRQW